jgi:stage IV sporulation protein B
LKKILITLICLVMPFNVLAYSSKVMVGGNTIGIQVQSKGIMIIGFYKVGNRYNKSDLKQGDYITKVNDVNVNTIDELTKEIEKNVNNKNVNITYLRNNIEKETKLDLIYEDGIYKTGLYVKDSITGIGTLSYIDPTTKVYGALGHEILESTTNSIVEIKSGNIFKNSITSIDKSVNGTPGSKNAKFFYKTSYGTINKNTSYGIYGKYEAELPNNEILDVAKPNEVKVGKAQIYTVLEDERIDKFEINITNINETSDTKNLAYEITDQNLIDKTGGIVQGMSGSPIVQNNKIIGVVTHVIVDNPVTGYGIFITKMLEEGDK